MRDLKVTIYVRGYRIFYTSSYQFIVFELSYVQGNTENTPMGSSNKKKLETHTYLIDTYE